MILGTIRRRLFGISVEETYCVRRGFRVADDRVRQRLEKVGETFLHGYHTALETASVVPLASALDQVDNEWRGFAYEGAAMGLALQDFMTRGRRLQNFLAGPGANHVYMMHVGAGWALARLPMQWFGGIQPQPWLDPLLGWLAIDGYGFHEGYFHWPERITRRSVPSGLSPHAAHVFDQGLGRSLWFVEGANVSQIAQTIAAFPSSGKRTCGVGSDWHVPMLAEGTRAEVRKLRELSGRYYPDLAQGAAFGSATRQRAGNVADHTVEACEILCGTTVDEAAEVTQRTLHDLPHDKDPATGEWNYAIWRRRIQEHFARLQDTNLPITDVVQVDPPPAQPPLATVVLD